MDGYLDIAVVLSKKVRFLSAIEVFCRFRYPSGLSFFLDICWILDGYWMDIGYWGSLLLSSLVI